MWPLIIRLQKLRIKVLAKELVLYIHTYIAEDT